MTAPADEKKPLPWVKASDCAFEMRLVPEAEARNLFEMRKRLDAIEEEWGVTQDRLAKFEEAARMVLAGLSDPGKINDDRNPFIIGLGLLCALLAEKEGKDE